MAIPLTEANLNDPVTKHMRPQINRLPARATVGEALELIRSQQPEGRIVYFYVVDDAGRLEGVVPTRRLLLGALDQKLADLMVRQVIALPAEATVLDACEFFTLHRLLAFPVVDAERRLLGVIDVDLYTDELSSLGEGEKPPDDLFQLIGVHVAHARPMSPVAAFRTRFPWLACNLAGGIAAAFLSGLYRDVLALVSTTLFIPVVMSLSESVSIQSVSLAVQMLHGRRPDWRLLRRQLLGEAGTGVLLGGGTGLVVALVALVWLHKPGVSACLVGGILGGVACAAVVGLTLPNLLHLLRLDPRLAAGPLTLACSDLLTLLLYFNLARWLLV